MKKEARAKKRPQLSARLNKYWDLYLLLIPVVLYFIIFHYAPLYGIQIAFKQYNPVLGITKSPFIGFKNFTRFFDSYFFGRLLKNTVGLSLFQLLAGFPMPILLAIMMSELKDSFFKRSSQLILYAPRFISVVVVVGMISLLFSYSSGIVNTLLEFLGRERIDFLATPKYFKSLYVFSGVWQNTGWNSIIFVSAISAIDSEIYEAAVVDGASRFRKILHITLPSILPTIITMLILNLGQVMNIGFNKVYLMQNPLNMDSSDIISTFVYRSGIIQAEYGFATAVDLFNNVINFLLLIGANRMAKELTDHGLW